MNERQILSQALVLLSDGHTCPPRGKSWLALDEHGTRVRPTDETAVAWTSIGAVHAVAPVRETSLWAETTSAGWDACMLLDRAAVDQGFPNTTEVDRAGIGPVYRLFARAIDLYEPPRRRRLSAVGTGGQPRGAT